MKRDIPDIYEFAASKRVSLSRIMDFTSTVNPIGPPAKARNAIRKNLGNLGCRPDPEARYLVRAIARAEGVSENNVLVGESLETLVAALLHAFGDRTLLIEAPYPAYLRDLLEGPEEPRFFSLDGGDGFRFDPFRFAAEMRHCDAAILASPSFLSSETLSRDGARGIISEAGEHHTLLIIDETLKGYSGTPSLAADILQREGCVVMGSLGEYYGLAGLSVSYVIGTAAVIEDMRRRKAVTPPNTLAAAAATASLRDPTFSARTRTFMERERSFIAEGLRGIPGISFSSSACGSFIVTLVDDPSKPLETFEHYRIVVDDLGDAGTLFFPVKDHKWNARYLKTLKNIMGTPKQ
ncbi:MAG TPA: aminotransferase class I/II-fold pyridoxal phosphate-dependent enzyme [Syntrophorhabdaceae bacterium]|nr:aminotransferase class I/II-fold pyridoxal phosphate-dependent enzyme [Syntrophorhabdaceae bacterium]